MRQVIFPRESVLPEAADQTANMLAVDPGHTTGLAGWTPAWGLQVLEVGADEWPTSLFELWAYRRIVIEAFSTHGPRTKKATEAIRVGGLIEGAFAVMGGENLALEVKRPRPPERYPKMARAKGLLRGTDLAGSAHAHDALAHLLVALETWKP